MIFCVLKEHTMTNKEQLAMLAELKDKQYKEREDGSREIIYALNSYIDGQIKYLEDKKL